ncbi:MAG: TetR/AcrR family transcriptional regulator [Spirochaetia bacterium]
MKKKKGPTKRQKQAAATRKRIYETAMRLMRANGIADVTIADIAETAGVSVGAFYHYFESKDAIFFETYGIADDFFLEEVIHSLTGKSVRDRIVQYFDYYAKFNMDQGLGHIQLLYNSKNKHFIDTSRFMISAFRALVHEAIVKGEIIVDWSADEITDYFFIAARGIVYDWCLHDASFDLPAKMHRFIEHLAFSITK